MESAHLGERIRQARQGCGLTVYAAAKQLGIPNQALYRLERVATLGRVQVATLRKVAQLYGVSVDALIAGVPDGRVDAA
jgi:transcriptional regulator with XRE-family HTH domain